jgi:peptidyl-tRNA hydrolase
LPWGVIAAQLVHAAGESAPGNLAPGTHAVVLGVESEAALQEIEARLFQFDVPHHAIREPDAPWLGALMAIGIPPMVPTKQLRKVTKKLRLLR